ncbi:trehalose-phosphatase [Benzoatithermus flavus]|uniref:Trehalose 6-phosphate phosphatase n=1 Tax=Benzoatithermus flavus TaxID=3108223 RepID=A0ABU8XUZ1_9PROT
MNKPLLPEPPPLDLDRSALFLDYDGTLVGIAPTPAEARADDELRDLLRDLLVRLNGAVAIISGRRVADIDHFLAPLRLTVAGLHGLELRRHDGSLVQCAAADDSLERVRAAFRSFVARNPGTLLEDKRLTVALHYRLAPSAAEEAAVLAARLAEESGGTLRLQQGKMVVELLPAGRDKGRAIEDLLALPEFAGRDPVFVGDDVTDEAGFLVVNRRGGISVRVGAADHPTEARRCLADIGALRRWLHASLAR